MTSKLPDILDRYFAAQNAHDVEAMVTCFAANATVRDEGHDHIGTDAIRRWKADTSAKYRISAKPLERREQNGHTIVTARVAGNFPGSPVDLAYRFGLSSDDLIDTLEVH